MPLTQVMRLFVANRISFVNYSMSRSPEQNSHTHSHKNTRKNAQKLYIDDNRRFPHIIL